MRYLYSTSRSFPKSTWVSTERIILDACNVRSIVMPDKRTFDGCKECGLPVGSGKVTGQPGTDTEPTHWSVSLAKY